MWAVATVVLCSIILLSYSISMFFNFRFPPQTRKDEKTCYVSSSLCATRLQAVITLCFSLFSKPEGLGLSMRCSAHLDCRCLDKQITAIHANSQMKVMHCRAFVAALSCHTRVLYLHRPLMGCLGRVGRQMPDQPVFNTSPCHLPSETSF